ncbi:MAG: alpha/beta hydrolase-fold protein [Bdellovibrionales bacterium]
MRFFVLFVLCCSHFFASAVEVCGQFTHPVEGSYCIYQDPTSTNQDVLYYLHGRGGRAERWGETNFFTEQVRRHWSQQGQSAPTVISISFGPEWILAEKSEAELSGLLNLVRDGLMPMLEQKIGGVQGKRMLVGESMGGFNGLQLALKTDLFARAAIICAPVYTAEMSPYSSDEEILRYVKASSVYSVYGEDGLPEILAHLQGIRQLGTDVFTRDNWPSNDPLMMAAALPESKSKMEFYLAAGFYDPYALYEGNSALADTLKQKGYPVEWHPMWGGHCAIDIPSLAQFLVH